MVQTLAISVEKMMQCSVRKTYFNIDENCYKKLKSVYCNVLTESDLLPFLVTFIACLVLGVEVGILVGIAVNLLFILYSSARPYVALQWIVVSTLLLITYLL